MVKRLSIACIAVGLTLTAWQISREIPPTDDPSHPGQPAWCQNYTDPNTGFKHNCMECRRKCEPGEPEDNKCKTYCRKGACKCNHGCDTD